jgi:purine-cytosine permease-like protein
MDLMWWIVAFVIWLALLAIFGLRALGKGHTVLFFIGFLLPVFWIVGALLPPTNAAQTADARARLR